MKQTKTILYAEDDAVTLAAYKSCLEEAGYIVQPAVDGLEALKKLNQAPPDLLLLDLMLPKFTGEEVLKYMNSNPALAQIPVVILSANTILGTPHEHLVGNAGRHLLKHDCTVPKLLSAVEELLAVENTTAQAGQLARIAKSNHATTSQTAGDHEDPDLASTDPLIKEIRKMQDHSPVVCAWTDRINIDGKWMKLTEFLSEQLHLKVSHGVSPEGAQHFLAANNNRNHRDEPHPANLADAEVK